MCTALLFRKRRPQPLIFNLEVHTKLDAVENLFNYYTWLFFKYEKIRMKAAMTGSLAAELGAGQIEVAFA